MTGDTETLYTSELSPFGARLRLAAAFTGRRNLHIIAPPGGTGSAEMKEINPFGQVPTLVIDGTILIESFALLEFFAETGTANSLMPHGATARARIRGIGRAHDNQVIPAMAPIFAQLRAPAPDETIIKSAFDQMAAKLTALITLFDPTDFVVGSALSITDLAIIPFASLTNALASRFNQASPYKTIPRLADWWTTVSTIPEVAAELTRHRAAMAKIFGAAS
jgi:glutathione S-transferase